MLACLGCNHVSLAFQPCMRERILSIAIASLHDSLELKALFVQIMDIACLHQIPMLNKDAACSVPLLHGEGVRLPSQIYGSYNQ